tara:strand:+ start:239132 stop:239668 length:537 start_codon:yes stop_codon:yes gene_type:complete
MKNTTFYFILTLLFTFTACTDDDDNGNNGDGPNVGANEITFDISGAVEGEKSGASYVVIVQDFSYLISSNDGTSSSDQTFSLVFHKSFDDGNASANPAPGTYPIGTVGDLMDQDGFWVVYSDTQNNQEFGGQNVDGTLTITSNSNNQLKGTFEFSAGSYEGSEGTITVTNGSFSAAID